MSREKIDLYKALQPPIRYALGRKFDIEVHGEENVLDQPAILTPNHIRPADSPLIAASYSTLTGLPLRFVAKQEFFDGKGLDDNGKYGRTIKFLMEHTRMISVDREDMTRRAFFELQDQVIDRLDHKDPVLIFPEATGSEDGKVHKFKAGAALFAIKADVPILPVGIVYASYSNGQKTHVDIEFGRPVMPEEYTQAPYADLSGGKKAERLIQEMENRVADMTGMAQTGLMAQLRKRRRQAGTEHGQ